MDSSMRAPRPLCPSATKKNEIIRTSIGIVSVAFVSILDLRVTGPNPPVSINRIIPRTACTRPASSIRSQSERQSKTEPAICCRRKSDRWQLRRIALRRSAKRWTQQMTRATDGFSSHIPIRIEVSCDKVSNQIWWKCVDDLLFARRSPTEWLWREQRVRLVARIGQTSPEYFALWENWNGSVSIAGRFFVENFVEIYHCDFRRRRIRMKWSSNHNGRSLVRPSISNRCRKWR